MDYKVQSLRLIYLLLKTPFRIICSWLANSFNEFRSDLPITKRNKEGERGH